MNDVLSTLPRCQLLQRRESSIENIRITAIGIRICILPDSLVRPTTRNCANGTTIPCQDKWTCGIESSAISRASGPPIIRAVDHRVASSLGMIGADKALNPGNHCRCAQTIAGSAVGIVLNVQHPWQGDAVARPSSAMGKEVSGLGGAGACVGMRKMVSAADEACICCSGIMA